MTTIINLPPSLDERSFETVLEHLAPIPVDEKVLLDGRHTRWASPFGPTALRAVSATVPGIRLPGSPLPGVPATPDPRAGHDTGAMPSKVAPPVEAAEPAPHADHDRGAMPQDVLPQEHRP